MWSRFEPVRSYLYTVLTVILGLLVAKGIVQESELDLWLAGLSAVLGVPSVELARRRVTPTVKQLGLAADSERYSA